VWAVPALWVPMPGVTVDAFVEMVQAGELVPNFDRSTLYGSSGSGEIGDWTFPVGMTLREPARLLL
jgi:hypothetical protein